MAKYAITHYIVWTNILYALAGLVSGNLFVIWAGCVLAYTSAWMHHNMTLKSVDADWFGMYTFFYFIIAFQFDTQLAYALATIASFLTIHFIDWLAESYLCIGIVAFIAFVIKLIMNIEVGLIVVAVFAIAFLIRQIWDKTKYHNPTHSIWHVLTAIGFALLLYD